MDRIIDVILGSDIRPAVNKILRNDDHLRAHVELTKARLNERFTSLAGSDRAFTSDPGGRVIITKENRQRGQIALRAIAIIPANDEMLDSIRTFEHSGFWKDFDAGHLGDGGRVIGG